MHGPLNVKRGIINLWIAVQKILYIYCTKNAGLSHDSLGTSFYAEHSVENYTFICRYLVACNGSYMLSPVYGLFRTSSVLVLICFGSVADLRQQPNQNRSIQFPHHTQTSSNSSTIAAGSSNSLTSTRYYKYSCVCSWWWVEIPPQTCRAVFQK
jgi:hypothetical protein